MANKDVATLACVIALTVAVVDASISCASQSRRTVICSPGTSDAKLFKFVFMNSHYIRDLIVKKCNVIEIHEETFTETVNLRKLDLSHNRIASLDVIVFDALTQLTHLNLSYNMLIELPPHIFRMNTNLVELDLKANRLLTLGRMVKTLTQLVHLDLSYNDMLGSELTSPFAIPNKIKFLDFSSNDFSESSNDLLSDLAEVGLDLNFRKCQMKEVPPFIFEPKLNVKKLDLSENEISRLDRAFNANNIEIIILSDNLIDFVDVNVFKDLRNLQKVVMRNNKLKTLPETIFSNFPKLISVDLFNNLLQDVSANAFRGSPLKYLNIASNRFSYLQDNFFLELKNSGGKMTRTSIGNNPWQCACLWQILNELKKYKVSYSTAYNGKYSVCVTEKEFICKRQPADNDHFVEKYDRIKNQG